MKRFIRNFRKQRVVGILNICSLSLGVMISVVVGLWAVGELSFDNFHHDADDMYRAIITGEIEGKTVSAVAINRPMGDYAIDRFPEIEKMCRVVIRTEEGMRVKNQVHFDNRVLITDRNFFDFFDFPLKQGDPATALSTSGKIVISEKAVLRYFPAEDPIGQHISFQGRDFTVSGVMYDFPRNSHLQADMVTCFFDRFEDYGWDQHAAYDTYFVIRPGANLPAIEEGLTAEQNRHSKRLAGLGARMALQPLKDIHFSKIQISDLSLKGDRTMMVSFIIIAVLILVISCINFSNLFISSAFIRARTIGIAKSQGASRGDLIWGFYMETLIYVLISVALGAGLAALTAPVFNNFAGATVSIDLGSPVFYTLLAAIILFTVVMAGSFPALYMTRLGIIETLQGKFRGKRMSVLQRVLIIFQFSASIFLMLVVVFFSRQIEFIISQDLGFEKENIIAVKGWGHFGADFRSLREEFLREPSITDVSMRQHSLPFNLGMGVNLWTPESPVQINGNFEQVWANYFDFFGIEFVEGENPFYLESAKSMRYCVINETAARKLDLGSDAVDRLIYADTGSNEELYGGNDFIVKGVIKDVHFESLHNAIPVQMFVPVDRDNDNPMFFKVQGDPSRAIRLIERRWNEMESQVTFEYRMLDDEYEKLYRPDKNARSILIYALVITLLITVAGLFATAFYSAERRTREIAVRKVNGATSLDVLLLLNKEIISWVVISFIITCPAAWIFTDNWLNNFVLRTRLDWYVFLAAGLVACIVAIITVTYQTWKAARANPVDSLKNG